MTGGSEGRVRVRSGEVDSVADRSSGAGFVLDLGRCVGCGACVLACRLENRLPPGVSWRRIVPLNLARLPGGPTYFFSLACHHCENPPCARGCPSGALVKGSDGVVILEATLCLGCRYCEMACPFGAPAYDSGTGVMTKCHLCRHRLDLGRLPACVEACPTGALSLASHPVPHGSAAGHPVAGGPSSGRPVADVPSDGLPLADASPVPEARDAEALRSTDVPGFVDPGGAVPALWFIPPAGGIRGNRYHHLLRILAGPESWREEDGHG